MTCKHAIGCQRRTKSYQIEPHQSAISMQSWPTRFEVGLPIVQWHSKSVEDWCQNQWLDQHRWGQVLHTGEHVGGRICLHNQLHFGGANQTGLSHLTCGLTIHSLCTHMGMGTAGFPMHGAHMELFPYSSSDTVRNPQQSPQKQKVPSQWA